MAKDDFDIDFDFEKLGLDPSEFEGSEGFDEDMDFSDESLGLTNLPDEDAPDSDEEFDLDALSSFLGDEPIDPAAPAETPEDDFGSEFDFSTDDSDAFVDAELEEDLSRFMQEDADVENIVQRRREEQPPEKVSAPPADTQENEPPGTAEAQASAETPEEKKERRRQRRQEKQETEPKEPREVKPTILTKFIDLYFGPVISKDYLKEEPVDPANPRRRRRKSKVQIFKEVYLPPIVACLCLILVLSFTVGAISNAIREKQIKDSIEQSQLESSISAEEQAERAAQAALDKAAAYAQGYDYDNAISTLEDFLASVEDKAAYPEIATQRSSYVQAQDQLVEYMDPSTIPNLSFHMLMVDPARAFKDEEFGAKYNTNFVSIGEFSKILTELYNKGYVLVDFDSFTTVNDGKIFTESIFLPQGKKPIMITETMVNYWAYMIDGDGDGLADAGGDGFASKLVLDEEGKVKAEYVDSNGVPLVGDYDLVPILENFIQAYPDFSYRGARATLAVAGKEGIFGYRINSHYVSEPGKGQTFVDAEIAGAKEIVQALKDLGYTMACYTYGNVDYGKRNANTILEDLNKWTADITPVLGDVDVFVFAQKGDLTEYNGASFKLMQEKGFRYFVSDGSEPWIETKTDYVRQKRLMVTGTNMFWHPSYFTGIFDCNSVIDLTTRGEVPNA